MAESPPAQALSRGVPLVRLIEGEWACREGGSGGQTAFRALQATEAGTGQEKPPKLKAAQLYLGSQRWRERGGTPPLSLILRASLGSV